MANNYSEMSAIVEIPEEKMDSAYEIWENIIDKYEHYSGEYEPGECHGFQYEINRSGIWLYGEESVDIESLSECVQALLDEAGIAIPFFASWSYGCSKPRVDEFGGGAMCLRRDKPPVILDAMSYVQNIIREESDALDEQMR